MTAIQPDMIVRHAMTGRRFKVRSVSKTKAVCWPINRLGKRKGSTAIEYAQERLEIIKTATAE